MLSMQPEHVVVLESVMEDPLCQARVERMLPSLGGAQPRVMAEEELDAFVAERAYPSRALWGTCSQPRDPDVYFIREFYGSDEERQERARRLPHLRFRDLLGYGGVAYRRDGEPEWREKTGTVCQPAWELHSASGCPFRCAYCWFGQAVGIKTNIEEQIAHLPEAFARAPKQAIWKWDNQTDLNAFEPEWDTVGPMVERFARENRRWLLLYTGKSDNVDFLLDRKHEGQTVICWSLSPHTQASVLEPRTAGARERVEAAAKCQRAGYPVRFRFSPIIPVHGWREEYAALVEHISEATKPDVISLCPFGWMGLAETERCLGTDVLDPEALAAMRAEGADPDWKGTHRSALPFSLRQEMLSFLVDEIQRRDPETRISICLDTPRMWDALGARTGQSPDRYFCNCGEHCAPRFRPVS